MVAMDGEETAFSTIIHIVKITILNHTLQLTHVALNSPAIQDNIQLDSTDVQKSRAWKTSGSQPILQRQLLTQTACMESWKQKLLTFESVKGWQGYLRETFKWI